MCDSMIVGTKDTIPATICAEYIDKAFAMVSSLFVWSALFFCNSAAFAECSNCANNRNDVLFELDKLQSNWSDADATVWLNSNRPKPSLLVGEGLYFTMKSNEEAHFALVIVDSRGDTTVLKPDARAGSPYEKPSTYSVFPPLSDKCEVYEKRDECFNASNRIVQENTIGTDTVYLFASKQPVSSDIFMVQAGAAYLSIGKDLDLIRRLVKNLSREMQINQIDLHKYSYNVNSPDVQHSPSSRAISIIFEDEDEYDIRNGDKADEYKDADGEEYIDEGEEEYVDAGEEEHRDEEFRESSLVFNNINFAHDSAKLTPEGENELAALGNKLVDKLEQGELPLVALKGHTDSSGDASYNLTLSLRRARSVKDYLVNEWGLPESRIFAEGDGASSPVATNETAEGRRQNRRVEFRVVGSAD